MYLELDTLLQSQFTVWLQFLRFFSGFLCKGREKMDNNLLPKFSNYNMFILQNKIRNSKF